MTKMRDPFTFAIFAFTLVTVTIAKPKGDGPVVSTSTGRVRGLRIHAMNRSIEAFLGIPYALPPLRGLRFKKPMPVIPWTTVHDATTRAPACMQYMTGNLTQFPWVASLKFFSEDCLYLNIWTPVTTSELTEGITNKHKLKPVLFWMHSGFFTMGSGNVEVYGGQTLASYGDIVVVTVNYRLGVFGFLNLGIPEVSGNMGLYDQALALSWIKDNIAAFGGNPKMITIAGHGAGAVSVGIHMISPLTRRLFDRVIMQSGGPYHLARGESPWRSLKRAHQYSALAKCADLYRPLQRQAKSVMKCLQRRSAVSLSIFDRQMTDIRRSIYNFVPHFGEAFMPFIPVHAIQIGNLKRTEVLIGSVTDEGSYILPVKLPEYFTLDRSVTLTKSHAMIFARWLFNFLPNPIPNMAAKFYIGNVYSKNSSDLVKGLYDSIGDYLVLCPAVHFAEEYSANENEVYFYQFSHRPKNCHWGKWMGVPHFSEVPFVFGVPLKEPQKYTFEEYEFSKRIMDTWIHFMRTGKPPDQLGVEWPNYTPTQPKYMKLRPGKASLGFGPHVKGCRFWKNFIDNPQLVEFHGDSA